MTIDINKYKYIIENIKNISRLERRNLLNIPGIVGTGIRHDHTDLKRMPEKYSILVGLEREDPELISKLPNSINGIPVKYDVMGKIEAFHDDRFDGRYRPLKAGASLGTAKSTATGTIGGFPIDTSPGANGRRVLLSNNHVIARSNVSTQNTAKGDIIIQPGGCCTQPSPFRDYCDDCGTEANDRIGTLERWIELGRHQSIYHKYNLVDCACAVLDPGIEIDHTTLCGYTPNNWIDPVVGMFVKKSGRTTQCTESYIYAIDFELKVCYNANCSINEIFEDQIVVQGFDYNWFSASGDSGSLVVNADNNAVIGLLFAGNTYYGFTIINKIEHVQNLLQVSFGEKIEVPTQVSHREPAWHRMLPICAYVKGEGEDKCSCFESIEEKRLTLKMYAVGVGSTEPKVLVYRYGSLAYIVSTSYYHDQHGTAPLHEYVISYFPTGLNQPFELKFIFDDTKQKVGEMYILDQRIDVSNIRPDDMISIFPENYILPDSRDMTIHVVFHPKDGSFECRNGICSESIQGEYNSWEVCNKNCGVSMIRFMCTESGPVEDPDGPYISYKEADMNCNHKLRYTDSTFGRCSIDKNGEYDSFWECDYSSDFYNKTYSCENRCQEDPNGLYVRSADCVLHCADETTWKCEKLCKADMDGQYTSAQECWNNCQDQNQCNNLITTFRID